MNKRLAALLLLVALLLAAILLPENGRVQSHSVVHQHEVWPQESEEATGFDVYGNLTTHLPLLIVQVNGREIPGITRETDEKLICEYAFIDNPDGVNCSSDVPTQTGTMAISIRGNSSRWFSKKQYAVKLVDKEGMPEKQSLLGMPAESTWVLNGSNIDHSQIRNYMLYNISGEIMDYAPRCRLCEVFLTNADGELQYQGVYTLIEKPKVSKERLNLTPYDPKYAESSFVVQMNEHIDNARIDHLKPDDISVYPANLEYPDTEIVTDYSLQYIKNELLCFEKMLYDAEYFDNWEKVLQCTDLDSFVDYYIINEFFQNYDAGVRSLYLYKNLGGKFSIGPVWDFDGAFDNFTGMDFSPDMLELESTFYYFYLCHSAEFVERCNERYDELRKTVLSEKYLLQYIDDSSMYLGSAALRNCGKWYGGDYSVYNDDIEKMKTFVVERGRWMDEHFKEYTAIVK